jgi:hypothetical protein
MIDKPEMLGHLGMIPLAKHDYTEGEQGSVVTQRSVYIGDRFIVSPTWPQT